MIYVGTLFTIAHPNSKSNFNMLDVDEAKKVLEEPKQLDNDFKNLKKK